MLYKKIKCSVGFSVIFEYGVTQKTKNWNKILTVKGTEKLWSTEVQNMTVCHVVKCNMRTGRFSVRCKFSELPNVSIFSKFSSSVDA